MQKPVAQYIGSEVRAELGRQGRPQRVLAPVLDMTEQGVSDRLRGIVDFRVSELMAVAEFLGVPVTNFLPVAASERAA